MSNMNMQNSLTRTVLSAAALLLAAGSIALAQPSGNPAGGLGGPRVKDTNPPGARGGFGEGGTQINRKDRPVEVPFMMFMKTVNETLATGSTALTADQKTKIEAINSTFREAERAFRQEHGKELRDLMAQAGMEGPGGRGGRGGPGEGGPGGKGAGKGGKGGPGGPPAGSPPPGGPDAMNDDAPGAEGPPPGPGGGAGPGGRPRGPRPEGGPGGKGGKGGPGAEGRPGRGGPDAVNADRPQLSPEQREALMTKMRELRDKGPNQEDTKKSVWAVLSAEQQAAVQPKLDAFIKERTEERAKRMAEGQAARQVKELEAKDKTNDQTPRKNPNRPARKPSPDQPSPEAPK